LATDTTEFLLFGVRTAVGVSHRFNRLFASGMPVEDSKNSVAIHRLTKLAKTSRRICHNIDFDHCLIYDTHYLKGFYLHTKKSLSKKHSIMNEEGENSRNGKAKTSLYSCFGLKVKLCNF